MSLFVTRFKKTKYTFMSWMSTSSSSSGLNTVPHDQGTSSPITAYLDYKSERHEIKNKSAIHTYRSF